MKQAERHGIVFHTCVSVLFLTLLLSACSSPPAGNGSSSKTSNSSGSTSTIGGKNNSSKGKGCKNIGVLLPETTSSAPFDTSASRWENQDKPLLQQDIAKELPGAHIDYNNANNDPAQQQSQAHADLQNGDCILVVATASVATDATIIQEATARGVLVIAYDRPILNSSLSYFVAFDDQAVGQLQGQYIADHYQKYSQNGQTNIVMINGSKTGGMGLVLYNNVLNTLDPLLQSHKLNLIYNTFTPTADSISAQGEMQVALGEAHNDVQIAYVANDDMANGVIEALKAQHLNGKVLVTGAGAEGSSLQNILAGNQTMTIYESIAREALATAQLVAVISNGTSSESLTNGQMQTGTTSIPAIYVEPQVVDLSNMRITVLADDFVTKAQICTGLPAGSGGIC